VDHETLQENVSKELERLSLTLSVIETLTGGIVSQKLATTSSPSFVGGRILSSETSQGQFLNLSFKELNALKSDGKRFADSLARKGREDFGTHLGLATLGRIIEEQGRGEYGVETYYSLSNSTEIENQEYSLGGELWMVRERASIIALDMLRKYLLKISPKG
jgi:nicotinamide-nucleotide amidase